MQTQLLQMEAAPILGFYRNTAYRNSSRNWKTCKRYDFLILMGWPIQQQAKSAKDKIQIIRFSEFLTNFGLFRVALPQYTYYMETTEPPKKNVFVGICLTNSVVFELMCHLHRSTISSIRLKPQRTSFWHKIWLNTKLMN